MFGFSPEQVLFYSVKGGVGLSAVLFQTAISQFCVTAPGRWQRQVAKRASRAPGDVASALAFSTRPQQQLILSVVKTGFKKEPLPHRRPEKN